MSIPMKKEVYSKKCCKNYMGLDTGCRIYYGCSAIKFDDGTGKVKFKKTPCYEPED